MKVYAPMWFEIKKNHRCSDGAKNVWMTIKKSRFLPKEVKDIVDPVIQRNAFFAHPENLLIGMLEDKNKAVRKRAVNCILSLRKKKVQKGIRRFHVPQLNFKAKSYTELINWKTTPITEPPLIKKLSNDELMEMEE